MMAKFKELINRSEFTKNIATLMTGAVISQVIPLLLSPVLARLFFPEEFGVLALFVSIVSILSVVVSGRYELSILIPEKDEDAINISALCLILSTVSSSFVFLIIVFYNKEICRFLNSESISFWLYFVPLNVLIISIFANLRYLNLRFKSFRSVAISNATRAFVSSVLKITLGFFNCGVSGLMIGEISAHFSGNFQLLKNILKRDNLTEKVSLQNIKKQAVRYIDFPKFSLWASVSNTLSLNLNSIFLSFFFSISLLGQYALLQKVITIPLNLVGSSISDVYFQRASKEKNATGNVISVFTNTLKILIILAIPVFLIFVFLGEYIFVFVFGETWRLAGQYSKILSFVMALRFVANPLSITMNIFEKQKYSLILNIFQLAITGASYLITWYFMLRIETFFWIFSILMSLYYFIVIKICLNIARGDKNMPDKVNGAK